MATNAPVTPASPTTVVVSTAPAPAPTTRRKRRRLSPAEYKGARDFARGVTGYNNTSPIWGKPMTEVLVSMADGIEEAKRRLALGSYGEAQDLLDSVLLFNHELQKRIATKQVIAHQSK